MLLTLQILWFVSILSNGLVMACYIGPGVSLYVGRLNPSARVGVFAASASALRCLVLMAWHLVLFMLSFLSDAPPVTEASMAIAVCLLPPLIVAAWITLYTFYLDYTLRSRDDNL